MDIGKVAKTAVEQIASYPSISKQEQWKRMLKSAAHGHRPAPVDHYFWPNAILGQGLLAAYRATGEKEYLLSVLAYLRQWKTAGFPIHYVDNIMNGSLALWTERFLLQETVWEGQEILLELCREAQKACVAWLKAADRTGAGIFPYRHHHPDWLFADALGMVSPFLCGYGAQKKAPGLLEDGVRQLTQFLERGMDARTGLPYHGYDEKSGMKYGIIGWGRACGWMLMGLSESLLWMPKTHEKYDVLCTACRELLEAVFAWQREDGGFSWQLQAQEGHRDSSAEGMIGTAVLTAFQAGVFGGQQADLPEHVRGWCDRLCRALDFSVVEGTVRDCSGECRGFAEYPQVYGSYPWGTGSALAFFAGVCYNRK